MKLKDEPGPHPNLLPRPMGFIGLTDGRHFAAPIGVQSNLHLMDGPSGLFYNDLGEMRY